VLGEVWSGPEEVLARLDEYEGVEQGLFRRVSLEVGGEACWVYVAGPLLEARLSPSMQVRGGDWSARGR
jgi:gamma-glutamylcyclotransferase (GGCT)/AIG2-like uncharacterized protein YtfP